MAYASKEQKAKIVAGLKEVMPKGWKYSVAIDNCTCFVLTISKAPVDLVKIAKDKGYHAMDNHVQLNAHHLGQHFAGTEVADVYAKIQKVMFGEGWFDNSDIMTDFHHTAYYVNINLGKWNKGFEVQA